MSAEGEGPGSARPAPAITEVSAPYWEAAAAGRLVLQRCARCDRFQFPPQRTCQRCGGIDLRWVEASGRATLYSWTVCHPPTLPWFAERAPWPVAAVELAEGVRMVTNLVGVAVDDYRVGMPLRVDFTPHEAGVTLVVFRPDPGGA